MDINYDYYLDFNQDISEEDLDQQELYSSEQELPEDFKF